ncbi:hypothetical protein JOB18_015351 [Solea senegalensis]|uniref:Uncharacterized protein n=1 Tax=Solea senegalensis TaxID=28829 RepID=A0AAV6STD2_SOLSE|nr:hypothetical protein JOB18_015351 [Solea senegalensis]
MLRVLQCATSVTSVSADIPNRVTMHYECNHASPTVTVHHKAVRYEHYTLKCVTSVTVRYKRYSTLQALQCVTVLYERYRALQALQCVTSVTVRYERYRTYEHYRTLRALPYTTTATVRYERYGVLRALPYITSGTVHYECYSTLRALQCATSVTSVTVHLHFSPRNPAIAAAVTARSL